MELVAALAAFYLAYAVVLLSPGGTLFRSRGSEWTRGERPVLASLWPGRVDVIAERLLPGEWLLRGAAGAAPDGAPGEPAPGVAVDGRRLVVDGRPLRRLSTAPAADHLRSLLAGVQAATRRERSKRLADVLRRSLSLARAQARVEGVLAESVYLGLFSSVYIVVVFGVVPLLTLRWTDDGVWLLVLPVVAALHLGATVELWRLRGHLLDEPAGDRAPEVLMAFLFPPALLRARHDVVQAALCDLHPATIAGTLLRREPLRRFLAGELAYVDGRRGERPSPILEAERAGLLKIARAHGWCEDDLRQVPDRRDAVAACHCPRCGSEFVRDVDACSDCGSRTLTFPQPAFP